ncbi:class I histocompatibility antigen, F10 alpha chain-like [Anguilla anguilla]|uniref:class I histocompatibility antigen, F10 alpha chain-like n=1 Tax=Anguilla anguilla TaxID=7936 RepID=UPI0015AC7F08|nr:class I histocompatibility antigen, F10 alpha chain-like [Anguilla anguilla]XP_035238177.1 class I histocompatibility antigen, F10 alpha chain-like [Anguilla anguilla]XP_035238178.1 class I histocompatibility antigen, F10 alpha chain-like [Anguilla anguilla]
MERITALLFLLQATVTVVNTGSHSIWTFSTFIYGQTQFPEFSILAFLDDLQVLYYDSNIKKIISRSQPSSTKGVEDIILLGANIVVEGIYGDMKNPIHDRFFGNHTEGVRVHQHLAGCVLDNDKPSPVMLWEAYDGIDAKRFDMHNYTANPLWPQLMWTTKEAELYLMELMDIYQPICIQILKYYLEKEKNIVLRKERPRVRLIQKTCRETGVVKVSCLATGFYPRHINLTMLRDDRPIPVEELIFGEVLPNRDGTYQTRRTLIISSEKAREKHRYTCSVTHLTLDNKLDINWEPGEGADVAVISSVVVVLVLLLIFAIPAFIIYKKRRRGI